MTDNVWLRRRRTKGRDTHGVWRVEDLNSKRFLSTVLIVVGVCSVAVADLELARSGKARAVIVEVDPATQRQRTAVHDLKKYLDQVTGAKFDIVSTSTAPKDLPKIFMGHSPVVRQLAPDIKWDTLGTDDIVINTVGNDLILSGGDPHSTVYAIYTFLQDTVGCRWWAPDAESIPSKPILVVPALNIVYGPPLEARFISSEIARRVEVRMKLRLTFDQNYDPTTHTIGHSLLAHGKYFVQHPDWYMYCKDDGSEATKYTYLYRLKQMKEAGKTDWYEVAKRTRRVPAQPCLHSHGALKTVT